MTITPSYVGEPECNGVIERVETLAEAQRTIGEFIARYNAEWLIANGSVIRRGANGAGKRTTLRPHCSQRRIGLEIQT